MKKTLSSLALGLTLSTFATADIITLKDGTQLEGTITAEVNGIALVSVNVTKSIKEERSIKREDILSVISSSNAASDYAELSKLVPTPDGWTVDDYKRALAKQIEPFLSEHKTSAFIGQVNKIKKTLTEELETLSAGGIKIDGTWHSQAEQMKDQIEFDSGLALQKGIALAKSRRYAQALNVLDKFTNVYASTSNGEKGRSARLETMDAFERQLQKKLAQHKDLVDSNKAKLKKLPKAEAKEMRAEMKAASTRYKEFVKEQKKNKNNRWLITDDLHKSEMSQNLKLIEKEKEMSFSDVADAAQAYRDAFQALEKNDLDTAKDALKTLKSVDSSDEYYEPLAAKHDAMQQEVEAAKKAARMKAREMRKAAKEAAKAKREAEKKALAEAQGKKKEKKSNN